MKLESGVITGKRVLLVEDERCVRDTLRMLLSKDAHTVVEANNGAEAFALFVGSKFDLVVTDFEIPFVKGDELAFKIRRICPHQAILMITAFDHKPSSNNPVDAVLTKPFDSARLFEAMAVLLSQPGENAPIHRQRRQWNRVNPDVRAETVCVSPGVPGTGWR